MISDREVWSARQKKYLSQWDDYLSYTRKGPWDNSSNLHLPVTMYMCKALHARIVQAIFAIRPWWVLLPMEQQDNQRIQVVDAVMRWACSHYVNYNRGIETMVDDWAWDFVTTGFGIVKRRWDIYQRNAVIIKEELVQQEQPEIQERFQELADLSMEFGETEEANIPPSVSERIGKEVEELLTYFDGPVIETVPHEDIIFPSACRDSTNMDEPFMLCHDFRIDKSTLLRNANTGFYSQTQIDKIVNKGLSEAGAIVYNNDDAKVLKQKQDEYRGVETVDADAGVPVGEMSEVSLRYDINDDNIDEDLIVTLDVKNHVMVRATYLDRVTKTGRRPYHKVDMIRRPRCMYPIGLCELLYPINKEIDTMHNMRIDFGTITNIPFFFYKPMAGMKGQRIRLEPGTGVPLESPQSDINFPRFSNSTAFGTQEEQNLLSWAERLTSLTSMSLGMPSQRVGASRTASGMMSLLNEANVNIDVLISRFKLGYQEMLKGLLCDLQERLPDETIIRVTGTDGKTLYENGVPWIKKVSREEIQGGFDFFLLANSANTNRELEKQEAGLILQTLMNPLNLQTGIVGPGNIYMAMKNFLEKRGVYNVADYITEPQMARQPLSLYDELSAITQGLVPTIVLNDNHQAKMQGIQAFIQTPQFQEGVMKGVNSPNAILAADAALNLHNQFAQAIAQQQAQAAQIQQQAQQAGTQNANMSGRIAGTVGETGRPKTEEAIPKGQLPASTPPITTGTE